MTVLHGIDLTVDEHEFVAMLGPNGAGKSTVLRAILGGCAIHGGAIHWNGQSLLGRPAHERAPLGIGHVPEGRHVWPSLTVRENLLLGSWSLGRQRRGDESNRRLDYVLEIFPLLRERLELPAAVLSGGEQQMLSIGRALMGRPRLLLVDEPSIGLAPIAVEAVVDALTRLKQSGDFALLLVEQSAREALELCDRAYILNRGEVQASGGAAELIHSEALESAYFGLDPNDS
ncbi:MAG: ABC transporter ATP-binding protein [Candidatus Dormibacteraeota bacterium]|uniref:ABC transporter ATP-binding protein n=2 Tax=Candidatus Dormibacteria TaxID=3126996 RepID=A0A934JZ84_9BACT|nr:ABC transporter ATP-binding protein [Candidatus Dormibacteraeota bacterium]MBJ7603947.1 ABC transporter ATP-binding protein [Candidatus Dormibacteraeota bacterium]MBJ7607174.1 ABC transporter ATP-binding protein [Candidatus Dormibacteraeota bacterium]